MSAVPAPPPTLNNLDPHQRTRLLRSTRKLEALLGTTPHLLESSHGGSQISPSTSEKRTHRRERPVFRDAPPSSYSSPKSETDDGFVLVNRGHTPLSLDNSTGGEKRRMLTKKNSLNKGSSANLRQTEGRTKPQDNLKSPESEIYSKQFSHPLVLSLLTIPVSQSDARLVRAHPLLTVPSKSPPSFASTTTPSRSFHSHKPLPSPTFAPGTDAKTLGVPSTPTTPGTPIPLSPLSPTFYSNQSDSSERERDRERDVRRKKIAKLTRTLGENVPPELVFHAPPPDKEKDLRLKKALDSSSRNPHSSPRPPKSSHSETQSQYVHAPPPHSLAFAPPIVVIGPPPAPGARKNRKSPTSPQSPQSDNSLSTEVVIPPPPSNPAPLPPSMLAEKYRLEREKDKRRYADARLASPPTPEKMGARRPRSLSHGSGVDLVGQYMAQELDGKRGSEESARSNTTEEHERTDKSSELTPTTSSACHGPPSVSTAFHPNHHKIQSASSPSPTKKHFAEKRTHRHAYSTPSPRDLYFNFSRDHPTQSPTSASSSDHSHSLHRSSSKHRDNPVSSSKVGLTKSHSTRDKSTGGVEVMKSVESSRGAARQRDASQTTKHTKSSRRQSTSIAPSGPLLAIPECGRRKEREWSGEWNRKDMDEVKKALRGLKAR